MNLNKKQQLRLSILSQYINGKLYYLDAIRSLEVSERHFRRLVKEFRQDGIKSLVHKNKGKPSKNKIDPRIALKITTLYKKVYKGLNITHFMEKLKLVEGIDPPSYSTVRTLLLKEKLINQTMKSKRKTYSRRVRYEREGLLVQIDGSHHRWIFGHKPFCLTAAIDDATGKILGAKFSLTETTFAAMDTVEQIIDQYGVFQMLYSDKAGIYGGSKRSDYSNMNRAMRELGIIPIQANTPQAKGRIERLFRTLQSRLVQEMRLANIKTIKQANKYLKNYINVFNQQFAVKAKNAKSAFKKLPDSINIDETFTMRYTRKVKSGQVINYQNYSYVIATVECLIGREAEIRHYRDGRIEIYILGEKMEYECLEELKEIA